MIATRASQSESPTRTTDRMYERTGSDPIDRNQAHEDPGPLLPRDEFAADMIVAPLEVRRESRDSIGRRTGSLPFGDKRTPAAS